jgi:Fe-S-cluster containining protein
MSSKNPPPTNKMPATGADRRDVYVCTRCGNCCKWPGQVKLTDDDLANMAEHLGISVDEAIDQYTRLRQDRNGLALADNAAGACVFFEEPDVCKIHDARPEQCRRFPTHWNFPGFEAECEAIKLRLSIKALP